MRALYVDLDSTLLGPGGALLRDADKQFTLQGVRALQACDRAGAEVVLMSGRRQGTVGENARLFAQPAYIFEAGSCLVLDGEEIWLTGDLMPDGDAGTIHEQIEASGAPALLLASTRGAWSTTTPGTATARSPTSSAGSSTRPRSTRCSPSAATARCGSSTTAACTAARPTSSRSTRCAPTTSCRAGRRRPTRSRATCAPAASRAQDVIAVGDSREDMETAAHVGTFWFVANAVRARPHAARRRSATARTSASPTTPTGRASTRRSSRRWPAADAGHLLPHARPRSPAAGGAASAPAAARSCARARSTRRAEARRR